MKKIDTQSETLRKAMKLPTRYKKLALKTIHNLQGTESLQQMAYLLGKAALDNAPSVRKK